MFTRCLSSETQNNIAHIYVEEKYDEKLILYSEQHASDVTKKDRITAKAEKSAVDGFQEEEEGVLYGRGIEDQ